MKKVKNVNSFLRKIMYIILPLMLILALVSCGKTEEPEPSGDDPQGDSGDGQDDNKNKWEYTNESWVYTGEPKEKDLANATVYFHYHRDKNDYDDWNIWVWQVDGVRYTGDGFDKFGKYYIVDLSDETLDSYHAPMLGYIYHRGNWAEKDITADRFITFTEQMLNDGNEIHIFATQGNTNMYMDWKLENMICEIQSFNLDKNLKQVEISCNCKAVGYEILENDQVIKSGKPANATITVVLPSGCDFIQNTYKARVDFGTGGILEKELNFNAMFESTDFANKYTYDGNDLGVTVDGNSTLFKLWAPISNKVTLEIYNFGHPTSLGTTDYPGDDTPVATYELEKGEQGVWSLTVNENLFGKYYLYKVVNGTKEVKDIVDPYAKAAGLNGMRGYIADFDSLNPEDWEKDYSRPYARTQLVVYELHVRDLTMDDTWIGTEANRGKYLGLVESGTTYTKGSVTVKTGFDHITELGVNAVQILPFFDQSNDERSNEFNWGYNPQNYNVLEGQYSSNPYDANARIREFKQVVNEFRKAGIEVIMDVVYNHMNSISNSSFDKLVPGYFFRYNKDGSASNGSGCGNETASERSMVRKYILDSVKFWATEYNLSGFRFDLMGLHDIETMNLIAAELKKIDNNIVVWGEPWTGGTTPLEKTEQAVTGNGSHLVDVSYFNDTIRDKVKGSVFEQTEGYWLQGYVDQCGYAASLQGIGLQMDNKFNPGKLVNYVSCHDNNTLRDKLVLTGVSEEELADADVVAQALILAGNGISFILSGEEILRSKPVYDEEGNFVEYSHNSYNLPDSVNSIKWDEKVDNLATFELYKQLIAINKEHKLFQLSSNSVAKEAYKVIEIDNGTIVVELDGTKVTGETWKKGYLIFTNASVGDRLDNYTLALDGTYTVSFVSGNVDYELGQEVSGSVTLNNYCVLFVTQNK